MMAAWTPGPEHPDYQPPAERRGWSLGPNFPVHAPKPRGVHRGRRIFGRPGEGRTRSGRWARAFDRCQRCGLDDRPHAARGLCTSCYAAAYQRGEIDGRPA